MTEAQAGLRAGASLAGGCGNPSHIGEDLPLGHAGERHNDAVPYGRPGRWARNAAAPPAVCIRWTESRRWPAPARAVRAGWSKGPPRGYQPPPGYQGDPRDIRGRRPDISRRRDLPRRRLRRAFPIVVWVHIGAAVSDLPPPTRHRAPDYSARRRSRAKRAEASSRWSEAVRTSSSSSAVAAVMTRSKHRWGGARPPVRKRHELIAGRRPPGEARLTRTGGAGPGRPSRRPCCASRSRSRTVPDCAPADRQRRRPPAAAAWCDVQPQPRVHHGAGADAACPLRKR